MSVFQREWQGQNLRSTKIKAEYSAGIKILDLRFFDFAIFKNFGPRNGNSFTDNVADIMLCNLRSVSACKCSY